MKKKQIIVVVILCVISFVIGKQFNNVDNQESPDNTNTQLVSSFDFELEDNTITPIKLTDREERFFDLFLKYYDSMCAFKLFGSSVEEVKVMKALYNNGELVETSRITATDLNYEGISRCYFTVHSDSDDGYVDISLASRNGMGLNKSCDIETIQYEKRFNPLQTSAIEAGKQYPVYVSINGIGTEPIVDVKNKNLDPLLKDIIGNNSRKVANAQNVEVIYLEFQ